VPAPVDEVQNHLELLARHSIDCVVIGGVAAVYHGSSEVTHDLDVCYASDHENLERLVKALRSVNACLRGAPRGLPFILDAETLRKGLNFTFDTDVGSLDLLGEIRGVGGFADVIEDAEPAMMFGHKFRILSLPKLIAAKRAAGRTKDLRALPELEAIYEYRRSQGEL
jgi:hypothetical protein